VILVASSFSYDRPSQDVGIPHGSRRELQGRALHPRRTPSPVLSVGLLETMKVRELASGVKETSVKICVNN
jgi:hypothetical protein